MMADLRYITAPSLRSTKVQGSSLSIYSHLMKWAANVVVVEWRLRPRSRPYDEPRTNFASQRGPSTHDDAAIAAPNAFLLGRHEMMNQVTIQVDASESPDTPEHSKGNPLFIWLLSLIAFGMPATPSQAQTPTHRDVEYAKIGDRSLQVDLYLPTVNDNGKSPLVVWVHGGAWRAGSKDSVPVKHLSLIHL